MTATLQLEGFHCPACGTSSPAAHFHVRVGTEIPARFTRCPNETEEV